MTVYTGYWIQDSFIYGPRESGHYWVDGKGFIFGPHNGGRYWIQDNFIWGPQASGVFWLDDKGFVFGPDHEPPWLR